MIEILALSDIPGLSTGSIVVAKYNPGCEPKP